MTKKKKKRENIVKWSLRAHKNYIKKTGVIIRQTNIPCEIEGRRHLEKKLETLFKLYILLVVSTKFHLG